MQNMVHSGALGCIRRCTVHCKVSSGPCVTEMEHAGFAMGGVSCKGSLL